MRRSSSSQSRRVSRARDECVAAHGIRQQNRQWRIAYDSRLTAALTESCLSNHIPVIMYVLLYFIANGQSALDANSRAIDDFACIRRRLVTIFRSSSIMISSSSFISNVSFLRLLPRCKRSPVICNAYKSLNFGNLHLNYRSQWQLQRCIAT